MKINYFIIYFFILFISLPTLSQEEGINTTKIYDEPEVSPAKLSFLAPPEGFVPSTDFDGYINVSIGGAILMSVIDNVPYSILKASMTDEFFKENQMVRISETALKISEDIQGVVYKCSFETQGHKFIRMIVYAGGLTKTLWLNVTYPEIMDEQLYAAMMRSFQSINLSE
ncbi:MAG: hypothetical protein WC994_02950 [Brumimicrobium sp.]